jgi:hypothetical protein
MPGHGRQGNYPWGTSPASAYEHDGEGYMESADYQLPISQIVDMPKAEEDAGAIWIYG